MTSFQSRIDSFVSQKTLAHWNNKKTIAKCYLFTVPNEIIFTSINVLDISVDDSNITASMTKSQNQQYALSNTGKTCQSCSLSFDSIQLQREHFKSKLHQHNLKRKLKNLKPISAIEWSSIVSSRQNENESNNVDDIDDDDYEFMKTRNDDKDSAFDPSSDIYLDSDDDEDIVTSSDYDNDDSTVPSTNELNKPISFEHTGICIPSYSSRNGHLLTYRPDSQSQNIAYEFILNTSVISKSSHQQQYWQEQSVQTNISKYWYQLKYLSQLSQDQNQLWAVFILSSGRFAGTIFNCKTSQIVIHKVFRRYTVRAKAGGSQSSHDSSNGKAKSMGAILRRYGEAELTKDIQELLIQWAGYIQTCSKVLLSVPKTMRHIFFDFDTVKHAMITTNTSNAGDGVAAVPTQVSVSMSESPLQRDDERIVYIPFIVGKPTLEETKAVFSKCTTVLVKKISNEIGGAEPAVTGGGDGGSGGGGGGGGMFKSSLSMPLSSADDDDISELYASDLQTAYEVLDNSSAGNGSRSRSGGRLGAWPEGESESEHFDISSGEHSYTELKKNKVSKASSRGRLGMNDYNTDRSMALPACKLSHFLINACIKGDAAQVKQILEHLRNKSNCDATQLLAEYDNRLDDESDDTADDTAETEAAVVTTSVALEAAAAAAAAAVTDTTNDDDDTHQESFTTNKGTVPTTDDHHLLPHESLKRLLHDQYQDKDECDTTGSGDAGEGNGDSEYDWDLHTVINLPDGLDELSTPLHLASRSGWVTVVRLLLTHGADPTRIDSRNRMPYHLAKDKNTRDVYRKVRGAIGHIALSATTKPTTAGSRGIAANTSGNGNVNASFESPQQVVVTNETVWDWDKAGVGESITVDKMQQKRDKEKAKKQKSKQKKKEEKLKSETEMMEKLKLLEIEKKKEEEQKKKLMNILCDGCAKPFGYGMKPLEFNNKKCCSSNCVMTLRRILTAEAAMSRMGAGKRIHS